MIPVTVITGFLGSGKTSLLQRLLQYPGLQGTAVFVNELGEIALDHELIEHIDTDTVVLPGGCLCCAVRDDLKIAARDLLAREENGQVPAISRLVIETTGLANPAPIVATFLADPVLRRSFQLVDVVTTFDAVHGEDQLARYRETMQQLAAADRIVVTKTDLVPAERAQELKQHLNRLNPLAEICEVGDPGLHALILFPSQARQGGARLLSLIGSLSEQADSGGHGHATAATATCIAIEAALDWTAFGLWLSMLLHCHDRQVLRTKALLNVTRVAAPVLVQSVQSTIFAPVHLERWPSDERRSRIVVIAEGLSPAALRDSLTAFCRLEN